MKFLCLGYFDQEKMDALPKAKLDAVMGECDAHMKAFHDTGKVLLDAGLTSETTLLRRVDGKVVSYADSETGPAKRVGGVQIVEANDLEEATRIAKLHPTTQVTSGERLGWTLEIRPINFFEGTLTKR